MRKIYSVLLIILVTSFIGEAQQEIKIINPGGVDAVNGTYEYVQSSELSPDIYKTFWVVNTTNNQKTIKVSRLEVIGVSGTENATCWDVCPPAIATGSQVDWTSGSTQVLEAKDTNKTFSAHLYPLNIKGCSQYRYYFFFDDMSYIDSVDVYFSHGEVCQAVASINQSENKSLYFSVFPNPSNGTVSLDLQVPSNKNYVLNVVNVVGQNVISNQKVTNGVSKLDWSHLNPGMYFVMLYDGEKAIKTKKIQIVK